MSTPPLEINKIYRGDALALMHQLEDDSIDAIVTDPPYSSGGTYRGDRVNATGAKYLDAKCNYPDFPGDARDQRTFTMWSTLWMSLAWQKSRDGAIIACFTDWRQLPSVTDAIQLAGWTWQGIFVWDKTEATRPNPGRYRAQCEYVVWGTKGACRGDVFAPGVYRGRTVPSAQKMHQTEKPVKLIETLLSIVPEGGTVLDPFMGSGTTAIACINTGRSFIGFELHPGYYEIARRRIEDAQSQTRLMPLEAEIYPGRYNWRSRGHIELNTTAQNSKPIPTEGNTGSQSEGV